MTCRVEGGKVYVQAYNADREASWKENRISGITLVDGTCESPGNILSSWLFAYDGDGNRVNQVYTDGTSTLTTLYFMGGAYETTLENNTVRKYYAIAGMTVAMNDGNGLKYLLTDHLGSVVAVTDAQGAVIQQQRYLPFGQMRTIADFTNISATDFGYTGQRNLDAQGNADLGLMDYKARFYDALLGRFVQPDTIVLSLRNPQILNPYTYVLNNPIKSNDPSGHCVDGVTTELCLILLPTGPIGWAIIGILVVVDVVLIVAIVNDASNISEESSPIEKDLSKKMKGEYIPPGLNTGQRDAYREAIHKYKQIWGVPANKDIPHDILDDIADSVKKGKKPIDAAEDAPEPPEDDPNGPSNDSGSSQGSNTSTHNKATPT